MPEWGIENKQNEKANVTVNEWRFDYYFPKAPNLGDFGWSGF